MLALDRPVVEPDANHQSACVLNARTTTSPARPVRTAGSEIGIVNVEFNRIAIFHVVASLLWDRIRKRCFRAVPFNLNCRSTRKPAGQFASSYRHGIWRLNAGAG